MFESHHGRISGLDRLEVRTGLFSHVRAHSPMPTQEELIEGINNQFHLENFPEKILQGIANVFLDSYKLHQVAHLVKETADSQIAALKVRGESIQEILSFVRKSTKVDSAPLQKHLRAIRDEISEVKRVSNKNQPNIVNTDMHLLQKDQGHQV